MEETETTSQPEQTDMVLTETAAEETIPEQWVVETETATTSAPTEAMMPSNSTEPPRWAEPTTLPQTEPVPTETPGYGIDLPDDIWE